MSGVRPAEAAPTGRVGAALDLAPLEVDTLTGEAECVEAPAPLVGVSTESSGHSCYSPLRSALAP